MHATADASQSPLGSLFESCVNVFIGFWVAWLANLYVLPLFGYEVSAYQATGISTIFTSISIVRSYLLRRWFNARLRKAATRFAEAFDA